MNQKLHANDHNNDMPQRLGHIRVPCGQRNSSQKKPLTNYAGVDTTNCNVTLGCARLIVLLGESVFSAFVVLCMPHYLYNHALNMAPNKCSAVQDISL